MKFTRTNVILAVILGLLVALDLGLHSSGPPERIIGRMLPSLYRDRAARVQLIRGDQRIEATLDDEGTWVLPEHHGFPASPRTMDELLTALTSLTTLDLVSLDPAAHGEYGLKEGALTAEIWDADGQLVAGLVQGAEVPGGGASYVRVLGEEAVYRATRLRTIGLDPRYWLDVRWLAFSDALVSELRLSGSALSAPFAALRDADTVDHWRDGSGTAISAEQVKEVVRSVGGLFVEEVVSAEAMSADLGTPLLQFELGLVDGRKMMGVLYAPGPGVEGVLGHRGPEDPFVVRFGSASWTAVEGAARRLAGE